jgi:hypothetical protein
MYILSDITECTVDGIFERKCIYNFMQVLKYRSVTDIVRPIRAEIVRLRPTY